MRFVTVETVWQSADLAARPQAGVHNGAGLAVVGQTGSLP